MANSGLGRNFERLCAWYPPHFLGVQMDLVMLNLLMVVVYLFWTKPSRVRIGRLGYEREDCETLWDVGIHPNSNEAMVLNSTLCKMP